MDHAVQKEERRRESQQPPCFEQNAVAGILGRELNLAVGYCVTVWRVRGATLRRYLT